MYALKLYNEINVWRKCRKVAKEYEAKLNERGFRVDWVGRMYTVINLPQEVIDQPFSEEGYVLMKLREYDKFFFDMGISDYVAPEMTKITEGGAYAYLLVLSPDREYTTLWAVTKSIFRTGLILLGLRLGYLGASHYWENISQVWEKLINLIF